jgi:toxin YoeB
MTYKVNILTQAKEDLDWLRKNDKSSYIKCFDLIRELIEEPRTGLGKPERLKHFEGEVYSRRINLKDRIVYTIYEDIKEIDISSCRYHYFEN